MITQGVKSDMVVGQMEKVVCCLINFKECQVKQAIWIVHTGVYVAQELLFEALGEKRCPEKGFIENTIFILVWIEIRHEGNKEGTMV